MGTGFCQRIAEVGGAGILVITFVAADFFTGHFVAGTGLADITKTF